MAGAATFLSSVDLSQDLLSLQPDGDSESQPVPKPALPSSCPAWLSSLLSLPPPWVPRNTWGNSDPRDKRIMTLGRETPSSGGNSSSGGGESPTGGEVLL